MCCLSTLHHDTSSSGKLIMEILRLERMCCLPNKLNEVNSFFCFEGLHRRHEILTLDTHCHVVWQNIMKLYSKLLFIILLKLGLHLTTDYAMA